MNIGNPNNGRAHALFSPPARWVAALNDDRAGCIHLAADGFWRANNWSGPLGAFATDIEAEAAIRAAPAKPKLKKAPKSPPPVGLRFESLTGIEAGYLVFGTRKTPNRRCDRPSQRPVCRVEQRRENWRICYARPGRERRARRRSGPQASAMNDALCRRSRLHRARLGANPGSVPYEEPTPRGVADRQNQRGKCPQLLQRRPAEYRHPSRSASGGLCDLDLDCSEAIAAARNFLPPTALFGHASKRASHWIYQTNLCETRDRAALKFDGSDKHGLLEVRMGGRGLAAQTIFPPSVHVSGELIEWENGGPSKITDIDGDELLQRARRLAAAAEIARNYPKSAAVTTPPSCSEASWRAAACRLPGRRCSSKRLPSPRCSRATSAAHGAHGARRRERRETRRISPLADDVWR